MKVPFLPPARRRRLLASLAGWVALTGLLPAGAAERVGVYDSRVLAYTHFFRTEHQEHLRSLAAEGRRAEAAADRDRVRAIDREMRAHQRAVHLQVFSTAPCPEALAALGDRVEAVRREAGVARLASRWDEAALRGVAAADRVDVTAALIRDLPLTEKQRRDALELATKQPLPLWQAKALVWFGRL